MNIMNTNYHNLTRCIISCTAIFLILYPATKVYSSPYSLEVSKSSQELLIKNGQDIIKRYRVAFGKGGGGSKRQVGDNKTPIGTYKIQELRENSRFHFFMLINYPNTIDAWYGYKNNLIDAKEFKNIVKAATSNLLPPQDTSLGGYLGLHGIGEITEEKLSIHNQHNWTEGCIALKNEEITELRQYVSIGTTILIKE
ncbi:MAG: murein L,D-transpeptidase YafK [Gammaproteobacteria bacterium]|jgi:murein L,D-transpeptidase YafK